MTTTEGLGLRDRKRLQTRARLEQAAVTLVLRDGLERTTVDAISELADVSPRTFFNYFDSKDSAILGLRPDELSEQALSEYLADPGAGGTVDAVVRLLFSVTGARLSDSPTREDRLEIVRRYPHLLTEQLGQLSQLAGRLTDAVQAGLAADPNFSGLSCPDRAAQAELVLAVCMSAIRVAVREWAAAGKGADEQELERRATSLVLELTGRLT